MATKTVLETLEAARKLIDHPSKWTQHSMGADENDMWMPYENAPKRCMLAAWEVASNRDEPPYMLFERVCGIKSGNWGRFNDSHNHAEVLAAFDAAIAKEKEAQHA